MSNRQTFLKSMTGLTLALALSACTTVKMPNIDFLKSSEFQEDAANIENSYPDVADAPLAPTDIRSDDAWDDAARDMQAQRDGFMAPDVPPAPSEEVLQSEFELLRDQVQAYKADDPQPGSGG